MTDIPTDRCKAICPPFSKGGIIKKKQRHNTISPPKTPITQRLRTDVGRSVVVTTATQLVWLNRLRDPNQCALVYRILYKWVIFCATGMQFKHLVCGKNLKLGHDFRTTRDREFIFGMHFQINFFQLTQRSMNLTVTFDLHF